MDNRTVLQLVDTAKEYVYGAESVVLTLSRTMAGDGIQPIIGCITNLSDAKPEFGVIAESLGLKVVYINLKGKFDPSFFWKINAIVKKYKVAIIHTHGYKTTLLGFIIAKMNNIPIIVTQHLWLWAKSFKLKMYIKLEALIMRFIPRVVAVSEQIKREMIKNGVSPEKVTVIDNGINIDKYCNSADISNLKQQLNLPDKALIVGTLARLSKQKGIIYLLEAVVIILEKVPNTHFLIVGDGPLRNELQDFTEDLGISENIHFLKFRMDCERLLKIMDIFVLSSIDEGLPMALLEAMATKIPVVVTTVGSISNVIKNNENGCLVEPRNSKELAEKIIYLLNNEQKRKELSEKAFKTVVNNYSSDAMCKEYLKIYDEVLKNWHK